jgi:hypothetical protein
MGAARSIRVSLHALAGSALDTITEGTKRLVNLAGASNASRTAEITAIRFLVDMNIQIS